MRAVLKDQQSLSPTRINVMYLWAKLSRISSGQSTTCFAGAFSLVPSCGFSPAGSQVAMQHIGFQKTGNRRGRVLWILTLGYRFVQILSTEQTKPNQAFLLLINLTWKDIFGPKKKERPEKNVPPFLSHSLLPKKYCFFELTQTCSQQSSSRLASHQHTEWRRV